MTLKVYGMVADEGERAQRVRGNGWGAGGVCRQGGKAEAWDALLMVGVFGFTLMGSTRNASGGVWWGSSEVNLELDLGGVRNGAGWGEQA